MWIGKRCGFRGIYVRGIRQRSGREVAGQILRIAGAATKTAVRLVPAGNTGGANVSPFRSMPVPGDLADILAGASARPPD